MKIVIGKKYKRYFLLFFLTELTYTIYASSCKNCVD